MRTSPRKEQETSKIRMKLPHRRPEIKQRPEQRKPASNSASKTKFPNFKEVERNVKNKPTSSKRNKPFVSSPQRHREPKPRFSPPRRIAQPRGFQAQGQNQSRGILGQGGLLSKLFSRRSRKLDLEDSEESSTEILKLGASGNSKDFIDSNKSLPFLDES